MSCLMINLVNCDAVIHHSSSCIIPGLLLCLILLTSVYRKQKKLKKHIQLYKDTEVSAMILMDTDILYPLAERGEEHQFSNCPCPNKHFSTTQHASYRQLGEAVSFYLLLVSDFHAVKGQLIKYGSLLSLCCRYHYRIMNMVMDVEMVRWNKMERE